MADLPEPPSGPVRDVDAVSTDEVETPDWLGPAIDDGLYLELPSSLPTDLPMPMPNPDLETSGSSSPGDVLSHNLATGETRLFPIRTKGSRNRSGNAGAMWEGLNGIGPDDGERTFSNLVFANSPSTFPRSTACRLRMQFTDTNGNAWVFRGSGHLIDAETMLTAGHCVYTDSFVDNNGITRVVNDWVDWIQVFPGSHQGTDNWGRANATFVNAFDGWVNDDDFDWDIGMVRLDRAVGMLAGWTGWWWGASCSVIQDRTYINFSFPASSCGQNDGNGNPLHNGADMYHRSGQFDSCPGNQLRIDTTAGCFTTSHGGMSGSGYYFIDDDEDRWVHSIHSNGNTTTMSNSAKIWESLSDYLGDTFVPDSRGSNFDLQSLYMRNTGGLEEGDTVNAGSTISDMRFTTANATNGTDSGTWYVDLYLSTDDTINTNDTLLETQSYTWSYSAMEEINVNLGSFDLPIGLPSGTYWIGARLDNSTDNSSGNNETSGWDAFEINVQYVSDAEAISITPLTSDGFSGEAFEYHVEFANNGAQWTYVDIEIRASYNQIISSNDPLLTTYSSSYIPGLFAQESMPIITLPDSLADGVWYLGMMMTNSSTTDGNPDNNIVASATTFTKSTRPSNDNCADAITILDGTTAFDNLNASTDGEVHDECMYGGSTYNDVWYVYESPMSGIITATTCEQLGGSADYDTDIVLYVGGSCGSLTLIGCNEDDQVNDCGNFPDYQSTATGTVQEGDTVYIRVGAYGANDEGSGVLNVYTQLANDECSGALPIELGETEFNTTQATNNYSYEECLDGGPGSVTTQDIWFTYAAPSAGTLKITTCNQVDFDSVLLLYTGECDTLELIDCDDDTDGCSLGSHIEVAVQQGETYRLRVGGWLDNQFGYGLLSLSLAEATQGDLDGDGDVDVADILLLIAAWDGDGSSGADLDGDGDVDVADLLILLANWS
jgi:hypothetical protein